MTYFMFYAMYFVTMDLPIIFFAMWYLQDTAPNAYFVSTQRKRYGLIIAGCVLSASFGYSALAIRGWDGFVQEIGKWMELTPIGWFVSASMYYALLSPAVTAMVAWYIYLHPAMMARSEGGGWVTTADVRNKVTIKPIYEKCCDTVVDCYLTIRG